MAGFERTTGYLRASGVSITRTTESGYSQLTYISMRTAFDRAGVTYPYLTTDVFRRLSGLEYYNRRNAFIANIQETYFGLAITPAGSIIIDPVAPHFI